MSYNLLNLEYKLKNSIVFYLKLRIIHYFINKYNTLDKLKH
jgi:hypothetical protein